MTSDFTRRELNAMLASSLGASTFAVCMKGVPAEAQISSKSGVPSVPIPVGDFINSMGICIHHAQKVPLSSYFDPLRYLGLRNVRDDFGRPESYITLYKSLGIRSVLIAQGKPLDKAIPGYIKIANEGALLAIEGPNEPNNFPITYEEKKGGGFSRVPGRVDWTPVARYQRDLYAQAKRESSLKNIPVFNVSETGAQSPNVGLQYLEIPSEAFSTMPVGTRYADYINLHNYVSSTKKKWYVDNQAWQAADPLLNSVWDGAWGNHGVTWGWKYPGYSAQDLERVPRVTTETGWDSKGVGGERIQGIMLLNTYLAQFKRGWAYTFVYMLRDGEGGGGNQGVFNKDSSPKLAAHYIHNFMLILRDEGSQNKLSEVGYTITDQPEFVHDLMLQKSNGDVLLIIWCEKVDGLTKIEVTTSFVGRRGEIFDPIIGTNPIDTIPDVSQFSVQLSDHCIIIRI